ncbi:MAG: hypothetical protein HND58_01440 [Planctomycetota bacterium]|nr:MAG: hypothetical protein HND58_01440 [Planctomycetota bacterium]
MRYRAVTAAVLVCSAGAAMGQSKAWDGGAGSTDWFADLNWDPDGVPGSADAVLVQGAVPVAQSADIDVRSLLADTGLVLDSRSLYLAEPSSIRNFTLQGCCTRSVVTQGLLTLDGVTTLSKGTIFSGPGGGADRRVGDLRGADPRGGDAAHDRRLAGGVGRCAPVGRGRGGCDRVAGRCGRRRTSTR